jgi:peroxiredoxin
MPASYETQRIPVEDARGVAGLGQLPAFELPAANGSRVRSWDFRGRVHLVLWLAGPSPAENALRRAAALEPDLQAEGATLLVVLRGSRERAAALGAEAGLGRPLLVDADGRVHARLGADQPALLVVHRNSTVYWRAALGATEPDLQEALSWLQYINILEPECGTCVPAWPVD